MFESEPRKVSSGSMKDKIKSTGKIEAKSPGTVISEKARAKANAYTDEQRQALLEKGIAMIYGGSRHAKSAINRR